MPKPRIPDEAHQLRGTKSRAPRGVKFQGGSIGDAPEWLSVDARAEWNRLTQDQDFAATLAPVFRGALIEYTTLFGAMVAAARGEGVITATERQALNSLRQQLGLSPSSQTKVPAPPKKLGRNKWAELDAQEDRAWDELADMRKAPLKMPVKGKA